MNVLAACDSKYFYDHAEAFYFSALDQGLTPYINIINPTEEILKYCSKMDNISISFIPKVDKVYYSIHRFLIASDYLIHGGILVTDIDCFFNKKMPAIQEDVGLFLREEEPFGGMKVAAGILWLSASPKASIFINLVKQKILEKPLKWYVDQYAIYEAYLELKNSMSVFTFNKNHMDWEFINTSYMWTGKGNRKYYNETYIKRKKYWDNYSSVKS